MLFTYEVLMELPTISVDYKHTSDVTTARKWLKELSEKSLIACDFETAVRYTPEEREQFKAQAEDASLSYLERKKAQALLQVTALDYPYHSLVTHCSIAWSDREGYVFILDSDEMAYEVLQFLVTTSVKQVWFNASYDFKFLYFYTREMPKNYEDAQIYAKVLFNHVDTHKAKASLKDLAGGAYGTWAIAADNFTLDNLYDPVLLKYAAIDACATFWVWSRITETVEPEGSIYISTDADYSPWDQLPAPSPKGAEYPEEYFYHNTAKWLVRDTVRIMVNGLPIDLEEVQKLEETLEGILEQVAVSISENPLVVRFLDYRYDQLLDAYKKLQRSKLKGPEHFKCEFDSKKAIHRDYFMYFFAKKMNIEMPAVVHPSGIPKWSHALIKKLSATYKGLKPLVMHETTSDMTHVKQAMSLLAEHKAEKHNSTYLEKIANPVLEKPTFSPASSKQKQEFFSWMGIESEKQSEKTGDDSWDREQIEIVFKTTTDEELKAFTGALIDHSFAAIVRNNFVAAFYRYTTEGVLAGQYKLLGAKSGRYTSSNPNMLNAPSSKSIFSKPVKKCFVAPEGFIVATIDYSALEDRVMGNLSEDENKLGVFTKGFDGHCLAAYFYWPEEVSKYLPADLVTNDEKILMFAKMVDEGHKELKKIRSDGKAISFGLAYGCGAQKVATAVKGTLAYGEKLFNAYHNDLYPGITKYREEYVLKTAEAQGYLHLGLGFRIYSDRPRQDIRTLNNATCQFWSILSVLTINKIHQLIDKAGYENDILVTSTIYDSIYFIVRDDPKVIKWLNDNLIPIMEKDFMEGQIVKNSADLEIGPNWSELYTLPHNASTEEIKEIRKEWN